MVKYVIPAVYFLINLIIFLSASAFFQLLGVSKAVSRTDFTVKTAAQSTPCGITPMFVQHQFLQPLETRPVSSFLYGTTDLKIMQTT